MTEQSISQAIVPLAKSDLRQMVRLVRLLYRLSQLPEYRALVYPQVPETARHDPGHDAVMMGYDFHVTADGPRLIEVNTNAGGSLPAYLAERPEANLAPDELPARLKQKILFPFASEYQRFSGGSHRWPEHCVIIDEQPEEQFLYREMLFFADLLRTRCQTAEVIDPSALKANSQGVWLHGNPTPLVYNRHCDFYLEQAAMAGLRETYLAGRVCLTPNPHAYGLLADKRRLNLWSSSGFADTMGLTAADGVLLRETVPPCQLLSDLTMEQAWSERRQSVFKPVTRFGSRGVLLGEKITRKRFNQLPPQETLVQALVEPSMSQVPGYEPMKTDFRLFVYRSRVLGVVARLYRGQVTNMRTEGGGFARVRLV